MLHKGKAHEILRHGQVHGEPLTAKQRGLMGVIASGEKPTRLSARRKARLTGMLSKRPS